MTILIVDDNLVSVKILEANVQRQGHKTLLAGSGAEALDILLQHPEINLVITDIVMPEMDGLELLQKIKESPDFPLTPVILCTSVADTEKVKRASQLGCKHFLVKPVQPAVLRQKISDAIGNEKPALLHRLEVMKRYNFDSKYYKDLVFEFRALIRQHMQEIESYLGTPESPAVDLNLPKTVEMASMLGAERLFDFLETKFFDGDQGKSPEHLLATYHLLLRELKTLDNLLPYGSAVTSENSPNSQG